MVRLWTVAKLCVLCLHFLSGLAYTDKGIKGAPQNDLELKIRSAANLEELLHITHPTELKLWRCRSKLRSYINTDSRSTPQRFTRFAAAFYDIEILKVIDEEWQKTQCMPRETCVDVGKDLGTSTSTFYKPPCVSVYRCGGCCNEEGATCVNTSTSYVLKTLFQISVPLTQAPEPTILRIANHTSCKCISGSSRHPYAIIRRSLPYPDCSQENRLCSSGWQWDSTQCECVLEKESVAYRRREELAICGEHMEFEDSCECVCRRSCPDNYILNAENCSCECKENVDSCSQKKKIFHPKTCSCEDECPFPIKVCPFGKQVCAKHFRCPKEKRGSHSSTIRENP
ncbi:vascular endothelial growth factor D isoform X2 [Spea bombifrons]|uniref:vascular endothelial growth factor D isoform X2 n=1 Tax=Spea bombifrons TaxID=233779 RepID=UPI002349DFE9|nr:vascular endothelial growth factor D isoform X2 [Spea bombifrons]